MISEKFPVHIFIKEDSHSPKFKYKGLGVMMDYEDSTLTARTWKIIASSDLSAVENQTIEKLNF